MLLVPLKTAVENYLRNRADFYEVLLPRIPHARWRDRFSQAIVRAAGDGASWIDIPADVSLPPLIDSMRLRDLLKKPGFGQALGRTVVSIEDAIERAQWVEETGLVLFDQVGDLARDRTETTAWREACQASLTAFLRLEDDLRYHRLRLTGDD